MDWSLRQDMDVTDVEQPDSMEVDQFYDHSPPDEFEEEPIDVVTACIIPALVDTATELILPVFVSSLVLQTVLTLFHSRTSNEFAKFTFLVVGVALLAFHFRLQFELFTLALMAYLVASGLYIRFRISPWIICGVIILANEVYSFRKLNLMRIRMHLMLLLMKMVSFKDEFDAKKHKDPSKSKVGVFNEILDLLSYLFHPSSILLNSWHPRKIAPVNLTGHSISSLMNVLCSVIISLTFLLLSSCFIHVFIEDYVNGFLGVAIYSLVPTTAASILHKLLLAHCIALQFRCSHYFICYLTEASFKLWQMDGSKVCSASKVELPRSLVEVVVAWNIPMHTWLKKFVFLRLKMRYNDWISIIVTYFISSSMHGFNFQIWSVLLSLGIITYIEDRIRYKLSRIFNCCIMSRPCRASSEEVCSRVHVNQGGVMVMSTNLLFGLLAMIHLAFLGSTFDGSESSSYASNVLRVWAQLGFFSHVIACITGVIYAVI